MGRSQSLPRGGDPRFGPDGDDSGCPILHVDMDAFFASVAVRLRPELRGRAVVVGGVGPRGVVSSASYEARQYGVRSAMPTARARALCPHAVFLPPDFPQYTAASRAVMRIFRDITPLVEPLSLDEAFVDLERAELPDCDVATVTALADDLRERVREATGGITASVGVATSKLVAKIASDLDKPDGLVVVPPGTEQELLRPMHVRVLPGVGPATVERLRRVGVHTVAELEQLPLDELVRLVGNAHGHGLFAMARARDDRPVTADREAKSVSVEGTYDTDLTDRRLMEGLLTRQAADVAARLRKHGLSGRTVSLKVRLHDFTTLSRSSTLASPTDNPVVLARTVRALLADLDVSDGVRLLGVGVSGLADWVQEDLFGELGEEDEPEEIVLPETSRQLTWAPGMDVVHAVHGPGWVWGSGRGVVTVRFETAETGPGPVRSFRTDDPDLTPWRPAPEPGEDGPASTAPQGADDGA